MNNQAAGNYPPAFNINPAGACAAPAPILIYPAPKPDAPFILLLEIGAAAPLLPGSWFQVTV